MLAASRMLTLGDVLAEKARSLPDRTAMVCGGHRVTWPEADERVDRLAAGLRGLGVGRGDRVLWLGQNCHRLLETMLAAGRLSAVVAPVNWRQSADELVFVLEDAEPKVVVWQEQEIGAVAVAARQRARLDAAWIQHDGPDVGSEYEDLLAASTWEGQRLVVDDDAPVVMIYTAAFAGRPNGALLSHRAWVVQNVVTAHVQGITAEYVYLSCGPLFHVGTLRHTLATFQQGGTNVFARRVDAKELCRTVHEERCNGAFLELPTIEEMVEANAGGDYDLSSLRLPPGPDAWNAMITPEQRPITNGFGQTELAGVVTFRGIAGPHVGGAGHPSPIVEVQIVDAEDMPVPTGVTGELVVRGPAVMNGYHRRPELNAQRSRGGWHHTNDLARREVDGSITFVGPATRIVKSASENIYPAEVEGCLMAHPAVREVGVIGIPDPKWGQAVVAVVALEAEASVTAEELVEHCRARIASYKKPRHVELVDALPRTPAGAVDHDALDDAFGGGGYPSK